jgi:hypothetical protein
MVTGHTILFITRYTFTVWKPVDYKCTGCSKKELHTLKLHSIQTSKIVSINICTKINASWDRGGFHIMPTAVFLYGLHACQQIFQHFFSQKYVLFHKFLVLLKSSYGHSLFVAVTPLRRWSRMDLWFFHNQNFRILKSGLSWDSSWVGLHCKPKPVSGAGWQWGEKGAVPYHAWTTKCRREKRAHLPKNIATSSIKSRWYTEPVLFLDLKWIGRGCLLHSTAQYFALTILVILLRGHLRT